MTHTLTQGIIQVNLIFTIKTLTDDNVPFFFLPITDARLKRESCPPQTTIHQMNGGFHVHIQQAHAPLQERPLQPQFRPTLSDLAETALASTGLQKQRWVCNVRWTMINNGNIMVASCFTTQRTTE